MILKGSLIILFMGAESSDPIAEGERTVTFGSRRSPETLTGTADEGASENVAHQGDEPHNSVHGFERGDEDLEIERPVGHVHLTSGGDIDGTAIDDDIPSAQVCLHGYLRPW